MATGKRLAPDRCACDSERCADLRSGNFKPADELFFTASRCLRREKCARACRINKAGAAGSIQSSLKLAQPTVSLNQKTARLKTARSSRSYRRSRRACRPPPLQRSICISGSINGSNSGRSAAALSLKRSVYSGLIVEPVHNPASTSVGMMCVCCGALECQL